MFAHGNASLQLFLVVWLFLRSLGVIFHNRWVLSEGAQIISRIGVSWPHSLRFYFSPILTLWFMAILLKRCKPDNFESHNSLKLRFRNIWGLRSSFVNLYLNQTFLVFLLYVRQTWMTQLSLPISLWVVIRKDSFTHMHGLAVYVKEGLPFAWDVSIENSTDSYLCFRLAFLHSESYFFFLYRSPSSLCTVFDCCISSNIDEVPSINPPANVFLSLEALTSTIRTG